MFHIADEQLSHQKSVVNYFDPDTIQGCGYLRQAKCIFESFLELGDDFYHPRIGHVRRDLRADRSRVFSSNKVTDLFDCCCVYGPAILRQADIWILRVEIVER